MKLRSLRWVFGAAMVGLVVSSAAAQDLEVKFQGMGKFYHGELYAIFSLNRGDTPIKQNFQVYPCNMLFSQGKAYVANTLSTWFRDQERVTLYKMENPELQDLDFSSIGQNLGSAVRSAYTECLPNKV